jgi:hypothetical protein
VRNTLPVTLREYKRKDSLKVTGKIFLTKERILSRLQVRYSSQKKGFSQGYR